MNPQPKMKRLKLKGKAYKALMATMHARDRHRCGICRKPSPPGNEWPPHHIRSQGTGGGDEIGNIISACPECHLLIDINLINTPRGLFKFEDKSETVAWLKNRIIEIEEGIFTWPA